MSKRLVDTIRVRHERSQSLVEAVSIASIFPPYSSDAESDTSPEFNESSPRFSCSIDTIFPPAWSPSQSPPRFSFSIETFFPPARSPSQSDSSGNYEEIFPTDPFISTSSRRTLGGLQTVVIQVSFNNGKKNARKKAMRIVVGLSGVESAAIKGQDREQIEVKGEGIDAVKLARLLRKKVGYASIVSVAEEKIQYMVGAPSYGLPPYTLYEIPRYESYDTPSCSIM